MRVRIIELMAARDWSAYDVAKAVAKLGGSEQAVYRLARVKGRAQRYDARLLELLCEVFDIGPGELMEQDTKPAKKRRAK